MRIRLLAAFVLLTSCVFLTGLSMPDTPRPQRHAKSPVQTFAEKNEQNKEQAKQARNAAPKEKNNAQSPEEAEIRAKHKQADRSARTVLPSKRLR